MQKKKIIFYVLILLCTTAALVLDIFITINIDLASTNIIGTAISFLTIIFSLWFSYLLVVKQLYSNRYSSKVVGKYIYSGRKLLTVHFFVLLFLGFFLMMFTNDYVISSICFVLNCLIFIFLCGKNIYKKISEEEIRKAIKDKVVIILESIEKNIEAKKVQRELVKLKQIYDDAYFKNEISTCNIILVSYYDFFKKYIESRNRNIIQDDGETKETLKLLIGFQGTLLKSDSSSFATELNENILKIFYDLAVICIKCEIELLLKKLLDSFYYTLTFDNEKTEELCDDVYRYIYLLEKKSIELDKEPIFDVILEESHRIFYSVKFELGKGNYIAFFRHHISGILMCLENAKTKYYEKIYNEFEKNILSEISIDNCDNICILLSMLLNKEAVQKSAQAQKDILSLMKQLARNKTIYDNRFFSFVTYVVDKYKDMGEEESAFELQYLYARNIVEYMADAPNYVFPDFSNKIENIIDNEAKNKELSEKLNILLTKAIDKNKISWVGLLLNELVECLKCTKQKDKGVQLVWIHLFQKAAERVSSTNNPLMQEIIIRYYKIAIFEMDDLKIISKDLGVKIIDNLRFLCEYRYRENVDFTCEMVELLDDLLDVENNLHFINTNKDIKDRVYRSLFDIAVDSIEKNQDLVIKRISNIIGWRIKEMIENGYGEAAEKLLGYAISMYNLCRANKINEQTIVFIGTLFIIIGAYSGTNPKYYKYRNKIIRELKADPKNKEYLEVSKQLRQCEMMGWKSLLGDDPMMAFNKFWEEYNKK